jgi:Tfp pilus assembly protein PilO
MKREIITLIIFSISFIIIFQYIYPNYRKLSFLSKMSLDLENRIERLESYIQNINGIFQKKENYQEEIKLMENSLSKENLIPNFINFIQTEGSNSGILITAIKISPLEESSNKNVKEMSFQINFSASYNSLKNFISKLENSAKIIYFDKISFQRKIETNDLDISIEGRTFYK